MQQLDITFFLSCIEYIEGYPYMFLNKTSIESTCIAQKYNVDYGALYYIAKRGSLPVCINVDHHIENKNYTFLSFCMKYKLTIYMKQIYRRHQSCVVWCWNNNIKVFGKLTYGYLHSNHRPECLEIIQDIPTEYCLHCSVITKCICRNLAITCTTCKNNYCHKCFFAFHKHNK